MNAIATTESPTQQRRNVDYDRFAPLVRRNAIRISNRSPQRVAVCELISVGWIGLLEAVARARGVVPDEELEDFVVCRVRGAMFDHLRQLDPATRGTRRARRSLDEVVHALTHELGRPPEEDEIAARLELSLDEYHQLINRTVVPRAMSLDADRAGQIGAPTRGPEELATKHLLTLKVSQAMTHLPQRQQQLLSLMYQQGRSQKEAADVLHVGAARVCQLHSEAIRQLQAQLGAA